MILSAIVFLAWSHRGVCVQLGRRPQGELHSRERPGADGTPVAAHSLFIPFTPPPRHTQNTRGGVCSGVLGTASWITNKRPREPFILSEILVHNGTAGASRMAPPSGTRISARLLNMLGAQVTREIEGWTTTHHNNTTKRVTATCDAQSGV